MCYNIIICATGVLLRLMSETECLLSWEGVEGREVTYEAQFKKTGGGQDYKQVSSVWRMYMRVHC